ncbi:MAG TPA: hypothetical protein PLP23_14690 [Panacibacter sp.]|nr:hypothetical protein [Panacibacter sp.]
MKTEFEPIVINTVEDLREFEEHVLARMKKISNGGYLFYIHPFMLLEDIDVSISKDLKIQIIKSEPRLKHLSPIAYDALKTSNEKQNTIFHINGLFKNIKK